MVEDEALAGIDHALDGAALWGIELDTRYRVLAVTAEPLEDRHPDGNVADRRLQLLLYPCAEIRASLRRVVDGRLQVEKFEVAQLVDVVNSFGGATIEAPVFDLPPPGAGEWGPEPSLEGASNAVDGRAHTFRVHLDGEHERMFDLWARFDDARVHDPTGEEVPLTRFKSAGPKTPG